MMNPLVNYKEICKMDKIIIPKELGMGQFEPMELFGLEQSLKQTNQISQDDYIYFDEELNIRVKTIQTSIESFLDDSINLVSESLELQDSEESLDSKSNDFSTQLELMDQVGESSGITGNYPRSQEQETMTYPLGHIPRLNVNPYTNENKNLRTTGKRIPTEMIFFGTHSVILNVTECHPQLLDTYLEQWTTSIARDYTARHRTISSGEEMIRIAENYIGDVAKGMWEAFKKQFPREIAFLASHWSNSQAIRCDERLRTNTTFRLEIHN